MSDADGAHPDGATMVLRPATMGVDLDAIAANYRECARRAGPGRRVIASIKANAYGHGVVEVAKLLEVLGVFALWTGHVPEAISLRRAGIACPVIMFGGYLPDAIPNLLRHDLIPTIYDEAGFAASRRAAGSVPVNLYVKVDAGLGRLGVSLAEAPDFLRRITACQELRLAGVYTHLSFRDLAGQGWALDCSARFLAMLDSLRADGIDPPVTQLWGSSGLLAGLPDRTNAVCLGHVLYGLSPVVPEVAALDGFRPACRDITCRLIQVARHAAGDPMTFLGGYRVAHAMSTGVIALGLGEGMRRPAEGMAPEVLVGGTRARLVGTSLEHSVIDLDGVAAKVGDEVVLIGRQGNHEITVQDWGRWLGYTPLEVLMSFSGRVPPRYEGGIA